MNAIEAQQALVWMYISVNGGLDTLAGARCEYLADRLDVAEFERRVEQVLRRQS